MPKTIAFGLDSTPLDTDWDSLDAIFADMKKVAVEHPGSLVIAADDPGINYNPPRVGRLGWNLYDPSKSEDDFIKRWTITLGVIRKLHREGKLKAPMESLKTAADRKTLVDSLVGDHEVV
jgi:hypothetical protein